MGSLEDKVARLSPAQRIEAETYIDFLTQRQGGQQGAIRDPFLPSESPSPAAPPIIMADEIQPPRQSVTHPNDHIPALGDLPARETAPATNGRPNSPVRSKKADPGLLLDWID